MVNLNKTNQPGWSMLVFPVLIIIVAALTIITGWNVLIWILVLVALATAGTYFYERLKKPEEDLPEIKKHYKDETIPSMDLTEEERAELLE